MLKFWRPGGEDFDPGPHHCITVRFSYVVSRTVTFQGGCYTMYMVGVGVIDMVVFLREIG